MVSVVLDVDTWKRFSGIRLIITYEPSDMLRDIVSLSSAIGILQLIRSTKYVTDYVRRLPSSLETTSDHRGVPLRTQLNERG